MRHFLETVKTYALILVPCLALLSGCGGPAGPTVGSEIVPKFGGTILSLPSGKGVVEFGIEAAGAAKTKNPKSQVFAYYMKPDGTPMEPAPTRCFVHSGGRN